MPNTELSFSAEQQTAATWSDGMSSSTQVAQHYTSGNLLERLRALMQEDGADPDNPDC